MKTFEQKVHDLTLEVGGSHYPHVNTALHQKLVRLVVQECMDAISTIDKQNVYTTYDLDMHGATIEKAHNAIKERFSL